MTSTLSTRFTGSSGFCSRVSALGSLKSALLATAVVTAFGGCRRQERVKMIPAMEYIPQPALPVTDCVPALEKEVERLEARSRDHDKIKGRIAELSSRLDKLFRADRISRGRARGLQLLQLALEGSPDSLSFRRAQAIENRWTVLMHDRESATPKAKNEREVFGLAGKATDGLPAVPEEELPRASSLFGLALQRAYGLDVPVEALPYSEVEDSIVESFSAGNRGERWVAYGYLHPLTVTRELPAPGGPSFAALPTLIPSAPPASGVELADIAPMRFDLPARPRPAPEPAPEPTEPEPAAEPAPTAEAEPPPIPAPAGDPSLLAPGTVHIRAVPGATIPTNAEIPGPPAPSIAPVPHRKKSETEREIEAQIGALGAEVDERTLEQDIVLLGQLERDLSAVERLRLSRNAEQMLRLPPEDVARVFEEAGLVVSSVDDRGAVRYASQIARAVVVNGRGALAAVVNTLRQVDATGALLGDIRIDSGEVGTTGDKCTFQIHIFLLSR